VLLADAAWRASLAGDSDSLDFAADGVRLAALGRERRPLPPEALFICRDGVERVALGWDLVLARVVLDAALRGRPPVDLLVDAFRVDADGLLPAERLGRELDLDDDCDLGAPVEAPSRSSCLRFANSMMVVRPLC
jgi:hypothetical protein